MAARKRGAKGATTGATASASELDALTDPAGHVELWPIDRLIPYARNARAHSDAQVAQIAASMREWGWTTPVLVDEEGTLIAGHGRLLAARQLAREHVPVMIARGWSEAKKRAYRLADNQLALSSSWDPELLTAELRDLQTDSAVDLALIGFPDSELALLLKGWESDIDPAAAHGSELGDIQAAIRVKVDQGAKDEAQEVIEGALRNAGIDYELA